MCSECGNSFSAAELEMMTEWSEKSRKPRKVSSRRSEEHTKKIDLYLMDNRLTWNDIHQQR